MTCPHAQAHWHPASCQLSDGWRCEAYAAELALAERHGALALDALELLLAAWGEGLVLPDTSDEEGIWDLLQALGEIHQHYQRLALGAAKDFWFQVHALRAATAVCEHLREVRYLRRWADFHHSFITHCLPDLYRATLSLPADARTLQWRALLAAGFTPEDATATTDAIFS